MQYMTFMRSKDNVPYFITNTIDPDRVPIMSSMFDETFPEKLQPFMEVDPLSREYCNRIPDHPYGCRCADCALTTRINNMRCLHPCDKQNMIDLRYLAFPFVSNTKQAYSRFLFSTAKRKRPIEVLSPKLVVEYQYDIIMIKDNGDRVVVPYIARENGQYDFFITNEYRNVGTETSLFNYVDTSDVIEIKPEWGYRKYYLQIKSVTVWGCTTGQGVDIRNGVPNFTGIPMNTRVLLYRAELGDDGCPLIYDVNAHDRVRIRFYTVFNDCVMVDNLHDIEHALYHGVPYKFVDPTTVPRLEGIPLFGGRNIPLSAVFAY